MRDLSNVKISIKNIFENNCKNLLLMNILNQIELRCYFL